MSYIDGFLVPVATAKKDVYRESSRKMAAIFKELGAVHYVECWGDDLPTGKHTDFKMAVKAEPGETVVFSWVIWPSKEVRDRGNEKMRNDPRMASMDMPFDGQRMVMGGFTPFVDSADKL